MFTCQVDFQEMGLLGDPINDGLIAYIKPSETISILGPPFHMAYKLKEASLRRRNLAKTVVFPGPAHPQHLVSTGVSILPKEESDRDRNRSVFHVLTS